MSSSSKHMSQHLAPIMPFIEPTEPIELPDFSSATLDRPSHQHAQAVWKGKGNSGEATSAAQSPLPGSSVSDQSTRHGRMPSEEEAVIERTRMELEMKIGELMKLKNQLAQTEQRERELASRISA